MPSINASVSPNGPRISVLVGASSPKVEALKAAGLPVPQFVTGTFLVDTGASGTCVDPHFVASLGLTPSGFVSIQTPSTANGLHQCNQFDVAIYIPDNSGSSGFFIGALAVLETSLKPQGIDGLIGRDVLDRCTLIYNGTAKTFTLAY